MKIELKSIQHYERMSEETNCFTANLYIDGKLAGTAENRGYGGNTDYHATTPEGKDLIAQAEEYCKTLPSETFGDMTIDMNLEYYIDKQLEAYLLQKEQKKMTDKMKQHILVSSNPQVSYGTFKLSHPIEKVIATPKGREFLTGYIASIKPQLAENEKILNTNIPEEIFKAAGLIEEQYVKQELQVQPKTKKLRNLNKPKR